MLPSNVSYRCVKSMTVEGQQLSAGALLPLDSPVRKDPRKLEILFRTRFIEPADGETIQSTVSKETSTKDPLLSLTQDEVKLLLRGRGMATKGTEDAIRARLRAILE